MLHLAISTMTPFFAFIFLARNGYESTGWSWNRGKVCICMCACYRCVCRQGCVCMWAWRAHSRSMSMCLDLKRVLSASCFSPPFFFLLTAELVYLGERGWENLWGRTWWSRRETQPTNCLQLTGVSWCRGVTQNTIGSIFALAWFPCFGKIWTVGMSCDSFNLQ